MFVIATVLLPNVLDFILVETHVPKFSYWWSCSATIICQLHVYEGVFVDCFEWIEWCAIVMATAASHAGSVVVTASFVSVCYFSRSWLGRLTHMVVLSAAGWSLLMVLNSSGKQYSVWHKRQQSAKRRPREEGRSSRGYPGGLDVYSKIPCFAIVLRKIIITKPRLCELHMSFKVGFWWAILTGIVPRGNITAWNLEILPIAATSFVLWYWLWQVPAKREWIDNDVPGAPR